MNRVPTGITGFDELVDGGVPEGSSVLVSGGPGTGKTIFAMQYIYEGAKTFNDPGLFVTLETNLKNITWNMQNFNWDIKMLQDQNLMKIYRLNIAGLGNDAKSIEEQISKELTIISKMVDTIDAKRLALDSTTAFSVWIREEGLLRHILFKFVNDLKDLGITTVLTAETRGGNKYMFSSHGVEEFIVDGVVALYFTPPNRSVFVRKMRGTNHSKTAHAFEITSDGFLIRPKDEILWSSIK
ncbi:MAG: hypothetical protein HY393_00955 [Candidatus Diapherotrites archaeon]|nr:hypothetical protein [Candidatus Diapherotrites archaeon]